MRVAITNPEVATVLETGYFSMRKGKFAKANIFASKVAVSAITCRGAEEVESRNEGTGGSGLEEEAGDWRLEVGSIWGTDVAVELEEVRFPAPRLKVLESGSP